MTDRTYLSGPTRCREWVGAISAAGYGVRPDRTYAHRWVVEMAGEDQYGTPWTPSFAVMHECDNRRCLRFDHLRLGTIAENNADMRSKRRHQYGESSIWAKLTNADVALIRRRRASGETYGAITVDFPVNFQAIAKICRRETWRHLP